MIVKIHTELTSVKNANGTRNASDIKYLVLHYTANPGSTEYNNCLYYATADLSGVSAHYFAGEEIYRCVPDLNIAGHCAKWKNTEYLTSCRNGNSLSIEQMVKSMSGKTARELSGMENDLYFEPMTFVNTVKLSRELIKKYNIPITNVIRHYDVFAVPMRVHEMTAHKLCPRFMIGDDINVYFNRTGNSIWKEFIENVKSDSVIITVPTKGGVTLYYNVETDQFVDDPTSKPLNPTYKQWTAEVTHITQDDYLNVRTGAGVSYPNLPSYPRLALGNRIDVVSEALADDGRIWFQIRIAGKYYGYVRSDYLQPLTEIKIAKVDHVQRLIVRSEPKVSQQTVYKLYPALAKTNYVEVLDSSDRFFDRIRFQDQKGGYHIAYASRYYLERV